MRAIHFPPRHWDALRRQVHRSFEEAAFFRAEAQPDGLHVIDMRVITPDELDRQTQGHLALTDEAAADLIAWAWREGGSLVEAHSHVWGDPVAFSLTDVTGLEEWVPHVWWRLAGRPYAALVQSADSVDAVAWVESPISPEPIEWIVSSGLEVRPAGMSIRELLKEGL